MKFCEKLQKLRREKGYSQEQLADLLDVSRQSVSKWESGTTYPEMDKLLSLCKIFNVTLDDLTNDEVTTKNMSEKSKNNFSNFISAILDILNKSIEMFKSMNKSEVIKCIFELFILFIILLIFKIPFSYIDNLASNIFANFSSHTYSILNSIWLFLSNIIYLILFITIFIYVYKIRFLDKFSYEQGIKKPKEVNVKIASEEKIPSLENVVIKEKHSFIFFNFLGKIFNIFIKICLIFIVFPLVICFIFLGICTTISLIVMFLGIHYIGVFIALLGATITVAIIMELFIRFLLSSEIPFKRMFLVFISSLIVFCIGIGLTAFEISRTKYINTIPTANLTSYESTYAMTDDFFVMANCYHDKINYITDASLTNEVKIVVNYYQDYIDIYTDVQENILHINSYRMFDNTLNYLKLLEENLKDKTLYNYDLLSKIDITVISSSDNIELIKENEQNYYEIEQSNEYDYYLEEIESKNEQINNLEEQIAELQEKLDNIYSAIE